MMVGMFVRILWRSLRMRRSRVLVSFLALAVAATASTAMLNLYLGLEAKLDREFRAYGANVVVLAKDNGALSPQEIMNAHQLVTETEKTGRSAIVVPVAYAVARLQDGSPIVVVGTNFEDVRKLNGWWSVSGWPERAGQALVGEKARRVIGGGNFNLKFGEKSLHLTSAGTLKTGAAEDSRVCISLPEFQQWTGLGVSTLEIGITGSSAEIDRQIAQLKRGLPNAEVRPVRQIIEAEGRVIGKTRSVMLISTIIIALTVGLCVLASLSSSVLERRRDFALMKALGSSAAKLNAIFLSESAILATGAALVGFLAGSALSAAISEVNFHSATVPELQLLPAILAVSLVIALTASLVPLARLQEFQPAAILKGD